MVRHRTLRKELLREIKNSRARFCSILVMVALGVMFLVGLRSAAPDMQATADSFFDEARLFDVQIISTLGLTEEDISAFAAEPGAETAVGGWSLDALLTREDSQKVVKLLSLSEDVNLPTTVEGRLPETSAECALDQRLLNALDVSPGDLVTLTPGEAGQLSGETYAVTGIVQSPMYISIDRGSSTLGDGSVGGFVLLTPESFALDYYTVANLTAAGARGLSAYGAEYEALLEELTGRLEPLAEERAQLRYDALVSEAKAAIDDGQAELDRAQADGQVEIDRAQGELDQARADLDAGRDSLEQAKTAVQYGLTTQEELDGLEQSLSDGETEYAAGLARLEQAKADLATAIADGQAELDDARARLADIRPADVYVLDRNTNYGFVSYDQNAARMENLAKLFPIIFFVVAALVCLTTMTRMVEEERTQIGAVKALGYGTGAIAGKYLAYGALAAVLGAALGVAVGATAIPWVIFTSYNIIYDLPELELHLYGGLCLAAALAGLACTVGATLWAMLSTARQSPAVLMRPRAPRAGKRILLERVTPVWRRLSFSVKVSARNLFRYKKRLWMTVIGVAGCTGLLIAGLGLRSSIFDIIDIQFGDVYRYDLQIAVDDETAGADGAVEETLAASGNLESLAAVNTRSVTFEAGGTSAGGYLTVTGDPTALAAEIDLRTTGDRTPLSLGPEGVIVSQKLAELLALRPGDALTIDCGTRITMPVAAVCEHYVYHYAYMTAEQYAARTGEEYVPNEYLATVKDSADGAVSRLSETLLTVGGVRGVSNMPAMARSFRETINAVDAAVGIIILSAAALALVVLYNLTNINITERVRELATIKVLGFYDGEVAMYVYRENIVLTLLGIALGQPLGRFLCAWLVRSIEMENIMFGRQARPVNYALSIVLSLGFAVLVNFLMYFRMKKIDMVQSLKSVE